MLFKRKEVSHVVSINLNFTIMVELENLLEESNKKETLWDKIKDELSYYFYSIPRNWYFEARNSIRSIIKRFPYIIKLRDWDYGYVIEAELNELKILRDGIKKYQNHLNWKRDVETLNVAINLASEIVNGFPDDRKILQTNVRNCKRFYKYPEHIKEMMEKPDSSRERRWTNKRLAKSLVREEKVWKLYHLYRIHYMRSWWD